MLVCILLIILGLNLVHWTLSVDRNQFCCLFSLQYPWQPRRSGRPWRVLGPGQAARDRTGQLLRQTLNSQKHWSVASPPDQGNHQAGTLRHVLSQRWASSQIVQRPESYNVSGSTSSSDVAAVHCKRSFTRSCKMIVLNLFSPKRTRILGSTCWCYTRTVPPTTGPTSSPSTSSKASSTWSCGDTSTSAGSLQV